MLKTHNTKAFRQDFKRLFKSGKDMEKLRIVIELLEEEIPLDDEYRNHPLKGVWKGCQECHIAPNWLLVYKITMGLITFVRSGSHSEIFKKY